MNCKLGDLAFIIHTEHEELMCNVGRIVRVVDKGMPYGMAMGWVVESQGNPLRCMIRGTNKIGFGMMCLYLDKNLRPIKADPVDEVEKIEDTADA